MVTQELRAPLGAVLTAVAGLASDGRVSVDAELRQRVEVIRENVEHTARLLDDLMDLARVGKGRLRLHREPVNLATLLRGVVEMARGDAEAKGIAVRLDPQARRPTVDADPARLRQVFGNVLRNAVKFTPSGGTITLRTADTPRGGVAVEVEDSGIGIDPASLERIFEPFEQGDATVGRRFGGLGVGLTIARAIIAQHGGTITAHSEGPNRGATLRVELPA